MSDYLNNHPVSFEKDMAKLVRQLACHSRSQSVVWLFSEDIVAYGGHYFLRWPLGDNVQQVQEHYDRLRRSGGSITLGYLCAVDGWSACYLSPVVRARGRDNLAAGVYVSLPLRAQAGHKVPRFLWPLVADLLRLAQPDPSLRRAALARRHGIAA